MKRKIGTVTTMAVKTVVQRIKLCTIRPTPSGVRAFTSVTAKRQWNTLPPMLAYLALPAAWAQPSPASSTSSTSSTSTAASVAAPNRSVLNRGLAQIASETFSTLAGESIELISALATVLAWATTLRVPANGCAMPTL